MSVAKELKQQQYARRRHHRQGTPADWSTQDGQKILELVAAIAACGGAIRLGYTRDGGAYAIGIYGDGDPYTEYMRPGEDIEALLRDIAEVLRNATGSGAKLP